MCEMRNRTCMSKSLRRRAPGPFHMGDAECKADPTYSTVVVIKAYDNLPEAGCVS